MAAHGINRLEVELTLQSGDVALAEALLARVGRMHGGRLAPILDRVCTELGERGAGEGGDAPIRLDRLEVDLGRIGTDDFEDDLAARLEPALRAALAAALAQHAAVMPGAERAGLVERAERVERAATPVQRRDEHGGGGDGGGRARASAALAILEIFALTGTLPWWADAQDSEVVARHFAEAAAGAEAELVALVRSLARDPGALDRLARGCDGDALIALTGRELAGVEEAARSIQRSERRGLLAALAEQPLTTALTAPPRAGDAAMTGPSVGHASPPPRVIRREEVAGHDTRDDGSAEPPLDGEPRAPRPQLSMTAPAALPRPGDVPRIASSASHPPPSPTVQPRLRAAPEVAPRALPSEPPTVPAIPSMRVAERTAYRDPRVTPGALEERVPESRLGDERQGAVPLLSLGPTPSMDTAVDVSVVATIDGITAEVAGIGSDVTATGNMALRAGAASGDATSTVITTVATSPVRTAAAAAVAVRAARAARRAALARLDELYVDDAGLVLLWPFLGRFLERAGLVGEDRRFIDEAAQVRAVALLASLATPDPDPPEFRVPLAKLLAGRPIESDFALDLPLTHEELAEGELLLTAVLDRARALGQLSIAGLRAGFLQRRAALSTRDGAWLLQVERRAHDVVLDRLPWSWSWLKLPWMPDPVRVEW